MQFLSIAAFPANSPSFQNPLEKKHFSDCASSNKSVIVYLNADTQKVQILKENKGKSGIYCWKNNLNKIPI